MTSPAFSGFRVERELDHIRCVLPARPSGRGYVLGGAAMVLFGSLTAIFMLFWIRGALRGLGFEDDVLPWSSLVFALFGLPGLAIGTGMVLVGVLLLTRASHGEVAISREWIAYTERAGLLRWTWRRRQEQVSRLTFGSPLRVRGQAGRDLEPLGAEASLLRAEGPAIKPLWIAPAYPTPLLRELSAAIAAARTELGSGSFVVPAPPPLEIIEERAGMPEEARLVMKPPHCPIAIQDIPNGFTVSIPPAGIWKGSKGLFFFSLCWNGFIVFFTTVMVRDGGTPPILAWAMIALFLVIGIGLLLAAVNMGRRKVLLVARGGVLAIKVMAPLRTREHRLRIEEIGSIRVGPSGMEVNDVPVLELQIHRPGGKKLGLLAGREREDLNWLAYELRTRLGKATG